MKPLTYRETLRQIGRQADIPVDRQTNGPTDRQTDNPTYKKIDRYASDEEDWSTGSSASDSCRICQAGTFWSGSGNLDYHNSDLRDYSHDYRIVDGII